MQSASQSSSDAPALSGDSKKSRRYFKSRRTEYSDIAALKAISEEQCNKDSFGGQILEKLIEHSLISITVIEQTKRFEHVTGYASFNDVPTRVLPGLKNWHDVLQLSLPNNYFSTANSVFLTSLISEPRNCEEVLEECLKVLFTVNPELDYCLLLTGGPPDGIFDKYFPAWMEFASAEKVVNLSVCKKEYVWPEVVIREADVVDVPKLLPFFEKLHDKLRTTLGEAWLEKIVRAAPASKDTKCCVVEDSSGRICGFFSVTSANIDWENLNDHYETGIFHQFFRVTDFDRIAGRLLNYDVELGTADSDQDHVYGPRMSVPSTPYVAEQDGNRRNRKTAQKCRPLSTIDSNDEIPFTPSVERYVTELVDDLCNITVESTDELTSPQPENPENLTNFPVLRGDLELRGSASGERDPPRSEEPVLDNRTNITLADNASASFAATKRTSSATSTYLESAKSIINGLLAECVTFPSSMDIQGTPSAAAPTVSFGKSEIDVRAIDQIDLTTKRDIVTDYSKKLESVLSRLYDTVLGQSSHELVTAVGVRDALGDLLNVLEENAARILDLEEGVSTASFAALADVSRITLTAAQSLVLDMENIAAQKIDEDEQKQEEKSLSDADPMMSSAPQDNVDSSEQTTLLAPAFSAVTVTTLQHLITQLADKNAEITKVQLAVHELQLRLTPRQFHTSYPPTVFEVNSTANLCGEYQLKSTNIVGLCPADSMDQQLADHITAYSAPLYRGPATTARLSELAFGARDLLAGMNFAIKNPDLPVYDSEVELPVGSETDHDRAVKSKRKSQPPVEFETPEQALERTFKKEYGLMESANEPMFNSWDDLVTVPQPFIASIREDPGIRSYQRKVNRFFHNPILGRAGEFNYVRANGDQNGMYLLLFHLDDLRSTHLDKVLAHCFKVLPGFEYLITQIATSDHHSMLVNKFMRAALRTGHFLREDLFVLHISSLLRCDDLEFTEGRPSDIHPMSQFLQGKADGPVLLSAFGEAVHYHTNCDAIKLCCVVLRVSGEIIGFAIHTQETQLDYLFAHYNIDNFSYESQHQHNGHMRILHYVINPMFSWMNKFVIQELMRRSDATSIFYRFYPLASQLRRKDSFPCCLDQMNLIRPRRVPEFPKTAHWRLLPSAAVLDAQEPFALYHTNRRLLFDTRNTVTDRIVIIGASDTSLQVLRNLIIFPHARFSNIILIDPHGVAATDQPDAAETEPAFTVARNLFSARELSQLAIPAHCQVIYGRAITMNKASRLLHVNDKLRIPFDYMVIGTGTQFLSFNINVDTDWISSLAGGDSEKPLVDFPRRTQQQTHSFLNNYFVVNNAYESDRVVSKLEALREDPNSQGYFVIYGTSLEAYGCVTTLLNMSVRPEEILFVNPAPAFPASQAVFSSMDLEAWVKNLLFSHGIVVILEWIVVAYNEGRGGDTINSVTFWTDEASFKTYYVQAFFNFADRQMNPFTYSFVNSSYLIVDQKLVIDEKFYAFPTRILAGGAWCKYPRRFFVGEFEFKNVNSREIGDMISTELMTIICPEMIAKKVEEISPVKTAFPDLPKFLRPLMDYVKLPFGWYYCNISSPQVPVAGTSTASGADGPHVQSMKGSRFQKENRRLISTGSIGEGNLFEIYLDQLQAIDQITCVTTFPLMADSLAILHGMHEGWLELIQRFEDGYIKDLFGYIEELWLSCLFYDRFPMLNGELRRLLLEDQGDGNSLSVIEMINQCFKNQEFPHTPNNFLYDEILRRIRLTGIKFDIVEAIGNFLEHNAQLLPMYSSRMNQGEELV